MSRAIILASILTVSSLMLACGEAPTAPGAHTWVSVTGDDANPCSSKAPCKTFAAAMSKTPAGGEISVLEPGDFGAISLTKTITFNGEGSTLHVAAGSNGLTVNAGINDVVTIKNLTLTGTGGGNGIKFLSGNHLMIESVTISGFAGGNGLDVELGQDGQGGKLLVKDSSIANCGKAGFKMSTTAGFATATFDNVKLAGSVNGIEIGGGHTYVLLNRSSVTSHTGSGVLTSAALSVINVENSIIGFNSTGVNANAAGSTIRLSGNGIYHNGEGLKLVAGATIASDGTNRVEGNGASQLPSAAIKRQ
jgi:hypothetical protein